MHHQLQQAEVALAAAMAGRLTKPSKTTRPGWPLISPVLTSPTRSPTIKHGLLADTPRATDLARPAGADAGGRDRDNRLLPDDGGGSQRRIRSCDARLLPRRRPARQALYIRPVLQMRQPPCDRHSRLRPAPAGPLPDPRHRPNLATVRHAGHALATAHATKPPQLSPAPTGVEYGALRHPVLEHDHVFQTALLACRPVVGSFDGGRERRPARL